MQRKVFHPSSGDKGKRLDSYLAEELKENYSRSQIKRLIENSLVTIAASPVKARHKVSEDDVIEVDFPEKQEPDILPENIPIDIQYEDDDIIVLDKPSGMVVHPASGNKEHTLVNALLFHTDNAIAGIGSRSRPGIVHRLDKEVSGLMMAAKTESSYLKLVQGFKERSIKKTYTAFVKGIVKKDRGFLGLPIGRASRDRKKMAVRFFNSKDALTRFEVLKRFKDYSKLRIQIDTGRTHQIRVHMSYMGHPIIGDTKYSGPSFKRIALYAARLEFIHPVTGKQLCFDIDMPEPLKPLDE